MPGFENHCKPLMYKSVLVEVVHFMDAENSNTYNLILAFFQDFNIRLILSVLNRTFHNQI